MDLLKTMLSRILLAFTLVLVGGERLSLVINGLIYHNFKFDISLTTNLLCTLANRNWFFDDSIFNTVISNLKFFFQCFWLSLN